MALLILSLCVCVHSDVKDLKETCSHKYTQGHRDPQGQQSLQAYLVLLVLLTLVTETHRPQRVTYIS